MNGAERWKLHARTDLEVREWGSSYERFTPWRARHCVTGRAG